MTAQAEQRHGGGGALFLLALLAFMAGFVLVSGLSAIEVQTRADNHVEVKHGPLAREVLQRPGPRDYHFSASRQTVMVSRCEAVTCAVSYWGARGREIVVGEFHPTQMDGALELTSHFMSRGRRDVVIERDGYVLLGTW